jgi:hypothetical protein
MVIKRRRHNAPKGSTREKGNFAEQIVASMHQEPNVKVETNVYFPTRNKRGKPREIDVLITSQVAGIPIRIAIECKNEKEVTGVGKIDAFIGKLEHVGLSTQLSVYVSTSRYTIGANERAKEVGMKTLLLKDVENQINQVVNEVFQSLVYLLATIATVQLSLSKYSPEPPNGPSLFFYNQEGRICGSIGDLVWDLWRNGKIPERIGTHEFQLEIPKTWKQLHNDQELIFAKITVKLLVTGHVITVSGAVKQYNLVDAIDRTVTKWQVKASFPSPIGKHIVTEFHNEEDLEKYFVNRKDVTLISGSLKLPRIRWGGSYWPPSAKALQKIQSLIDEADSQGKTFDWKSFPFDEIEGTDLSAAYEPIWEGHPYEMDKSKE